MRREGKELKTEAISYINTEIGEKNELFKFFCENQTKSNKLLQFNAIGQFFIIHFRQRIAIEII